MNSKELTMVFKQRWIIGLFLIFVAIMAGCSEPPEVSLPPTVTEGIAATITMAPTETPAPPSTLLVCLAEEPTSLYLYGDTNQAADIVFQALYQGSVELVGFQWRSDVLEKIPSLADGDAQIESVTAGFSDVYLNPETLEPERLGNGDPYLPVGCRSLDCSQVFQGGQVEMDRLRVQFRLREGQIWSDGEPLTVDDSIFSFELAGHPDTPTSKYLFSRTFSYRRQDDLNLEWIGIPGFLDAEFPSNFWTPLPEHILAEVAPSDLLGLPESSLTPIGHGPYQIEDWQQGRQLVMSRNPEYASENGAESGFERIVFRFIGDDLDSALEQLATGECDVLDEGLLPRKSIDEIQSAVEQSGAKLLAAPGSIVERIDFGLQPLISSGYLPLLDSRDMRLALASCLNRVELADSLFGGSAEVPASFLPPGHPLYSSGENPISYDTEFGQTVLDEMGWLVPEEGDGVRVALGVEGLANDTRLSFTLLTLPGELTSQIRQALQRDLADCGVELNVESMPVADLFQPWAQGPIFGRKFQLALWGWPNFNSPACEMFAGWEVPSEENPLGINASSYQSGIYDRACRTILLSPAGTAAYDEAVAQVQEEFITDVPALPLFVRPRLLAYASWLCGPEPAGSPATLFWNLEEWAPCP